MNRDDAQKVAVGDRFWSKTEHGCCTCEAAVIVSHHEMTAAALATIRAECSVAEQLRACEAARRAGL